MNGGQHLEPGFRILEYRIESILGQGGFGVTYLAFDENLEKRVAIKEYLPAEWAIRVDAQSVGPRSSGDRDDYQWGLERFLDEARALARFEHPHINRVHRHFEAHGTAYIVLEYIEGESLADRLRRDGTLPPDAVGQLLRELISALGGVHRAGYVHRDIKPGNILLRADGRAVLVDFGAARQAVGGRSRNMTQILTPGYAPIEQYDSKGTDIGPWTDVYALGMVAYRCVTGCGEADLVESNTRARRVFYGEPDPLEPAVKAARRGYPRDLLEAIDRAIAVNERDRPQDVSAWWNTDGTDARADADTTPRADASDDRARPGEAGEHKVGTGNDRRATSGKARWLLPVAGVFAVAIAAGAIISTWPGNDEAPVPGDTAASDASAGTPSGSTAADEAVTGRLVIRSNVRDDEAFIDDEAVGPTGPEAHVLEPGRYQVRVEKKGRDPWRREVEVRAGDTTRVVAELTPASSTDDRAATADESGLETRLFEVDTTRGLREAVAEANDGDTLELAPGEYAGPVTLDKLLLVRGTGSEPGDVVLDHDGENATLTLSRHGSTLENLTVRYSGNAERPAVVVRNNASPRLERIVFEINDAGSAGLISMDESRPQVYNAVFQPASGSSTSTGDSNAVIVAHQARPTIRNSEFTGFTKPVIGVTDNGAPVVVGNEIMFSSGTAFLVKPGAGGSFRDNSINTSGSPGNACIWVGRDSEAEFVDNFILNCVGEGIHEQDGSNSRFSGNAVRTLE
jgi:hypothetical protein